MFGAANTAMTLHFGELHSTEDCVFAMISPNCSHSLITEGYDVLRKPTFFGKLFQHDNRFASVNGHERPSERLFLKTLDIKLNNRNRSFRRNGLVYRHDI